MKLIKALLYICALIIIGDALAQTTRIYPPLDNQSLQTPPTTPVPPGPIIPPGNLLALPLDFSGTGWTTGGVKLPVLTGQLGPADSNAILVTEAAASGGHSMTDTASLSISPGTYTLSYYFKSGPGGSVRNGTVAFYESNGGAVNRAAFDASCTNIFTTGPEFTGSACTAAANGYNRISLTITSINIITNVFFGLATSTTDQYLGDGSSNGYMWGPVLRQGTAP